MLREKDVPLTDEQAAFAAEHHDKTVYGFLGRRQLPADEFYDVIIFGYLKAVRDYLTRGDLRKYAFATIAKQDMRSALSCYLNAQKRPCRNAEAHGYIEDHTAQGHTSMRCVEEAVTDRDEARRVTKYLTAQQGKIIYLRAGGHSLTEIGKKCGMGRKEAQSHLESARDNIVRFAPDLAEAA